MLYFVQNHPVDMVDASCRLDVATHHVAPGQSKNAVKRLFSAGKRNNDKK